MNFIQSYKQIGFAARFYLIMYFTEGALVFLFGLYICESLCWACLTQTCCISLYVSWWLMSTYSGFRANKIDARRTTLQSGVGCSSVALVLTRLATKAVSDHNLFVSLATVWFCLCEPRVLHVVSPLNILLSFSLYIYTTRYIYTYIYIYYRICIYI